MFVMIMRRWRRSSPAIVSRKLLSRSHTCLSLCLGFSFFSVSTFHHIDSAQQTAYILVFADWHFTSKTLQTTLHNSFKKYNKFI